MADPYAELERLRGKSPVFYSEKLGYLVLTRMEDVSDVFKNPDIYSAANVQDPVLPICDAAAEILATPDYNPIAVMSNRARPDHTRIRKYILARFSCRRMQIFEPFIQQLCDSMVDTMLASSSLAEFVGALGHPLPGETIFRFISFPKEDDKKLKEWTTNRLAFTWGQTNDAEQIDFAGKMLLYWRYCVDFVRMWQSNPAIDFASELLAADADDPDELSYEEIQSIVYASPSRGTRSSPIS
jgi:hypothetical protein